MTPRLIIAVSFLLAAAVGGLGWHQHRILADLEQRHTAAESELLRLGELARHKTDRVRERRPDTGAAAAAEAIAMVREGDEARRNKTSVPGRRERNDALRERLRKLSPGQIRGYIAELRACEELTEDRRRGMACMAIFALIDSHPADGLDMCIEAADMTTDPRIGENWVLNSGLTKWAGKDPQGALEWVRQNLAEHGDSITDEARCAVIKAIAAADRKAALALIHELEITHPSNATQSIVASATTPAERIAALTELRDFLPTVENRGDRIRAGDYAIAYLARHVVKDGFDAATAWVESAGLTDTEVASFGSDLGDAIADGEQTRWIDWFVSKLGDGKVQRPLRHIMTYWAQKDYEAAGNWLNSQPPGEVKNLAISVYADTVASSEPRAAVQWAITLPSGKLRDETLHRISHDWPRRTPEEEAAAAAFELEYDIRHEH